MRKMLKKIKDCLIIGLFINCLYFYLIHWFWVLCFLAVFLCLFSCVALILYFCRLFANSADVTANGGARNSE